MRRMGVRSGARVVAHDERADEPESDDDTERQPRLSALVVVEPADDPIEQGGAKVVVPPHRITTEGTGSSTSLLMS